MPSATSIVQILWRYKNHEDLTETELSELRIWLEESPAHEDLFDELSNAAKWDKEIAARLAKDSNATWKKIRDRVEALSETKVNRRMDWRRLAAAASAIIILSGAFLIWQNKRSGKKENVLSNNENQKNEVYPVLGFASLRMDDGTIIKLDSARAGEIALQGNTKVSKSDSNALNYTSLSPGMRETKYNTLSTGKGRIFRLTLPDGTVVWMNSGSSLRFPVAFIGDTRIVELDGEAYFEVTKNKEKPFIVQTAYSNVRVLGTHFDVHAYMEEKAMKTTLLEGSVLVGNGRDSAIINPGQQIQISQAGHFQIDSVNLQQAMAWRNKLFWFQKTSFEEIMFQIARQYDIEVDYEEPVNSTFSGILPQDLPLSSLLNKLEQGGNVHFTMVGNRVTVKR